MSTTPPPMLDDPLEDPNDSSKEEEEESGVSTSGYGTATNQGNGGVQEELRSSTMEDIAKTSEISLDDDDDDDIFKSARQIEPEPEKHKNANGGGSPSNGSSNGTSSNGSNIQIQEEHQEGGNPFQDAHLKPQLQLNSGGGTPAPPQSSSILDGFDQEQDKEASDEFLDIFVTKPHKVGDGMSSYMAYQVKTKTNINYFKKKENTVSRRFSDFLGLHDKLSEKYLQNGRIIPPAPDKSMVGMAKVKLSKENNENDTQDDFIEKRRASLERYLNRTAKHPSLKTDPDFREFLEIETELPKSNHTSTLSGKNMMKMITKVGDKVSNLTLKMEETDEWFEEKGQMIEALDEQLRKLHGSSEILVEQRRNLSFCTGNVSKSLAALSSTEDNAALSGAISKLSNVQERIEGVHKEQADADLYELSELIKDYIGLIGAVKDAFGERVKAWQNWQNITANLTKKREAKVKAELQQKTEKINLLRQEIAETERQQEMAQENFEKISRIIKKEIEFFDASRAHDFKRIIVKYLEKMLRAQDDIAAQWERYLPEIQQIKI